MRVATGGVAFVLLGSGACSNDATAPLADGAAAETSASPAEVTVATKFLGTWDCYPYRQSSPSENSSETASAVAGGRLRLENERAMPVCTRSGEAPCETKSVVHFELTTASDSTRSGDLVVQPEAPAVLWSGNFFPVDASAAKGGAPRVNGKLPFRANDTGDVIESFFVNDSSGIIFPAAGVMACLPHVSR